MSSLYRIYLDPQHNWTAVGGAFIPVPYSSVTSASARSQLQLGPEDPRMCAHGPRMGMGPGSAGSRSLVTVFNMLTPTKEVVEVEQQGGLQQPIVKWVRQIHALEQEDIGPDLATSPSSPPTRVVVETSAVSGRLLRPELSFRGNLVPQQRTGNSEL